MVEGKMKGFPQRGGRIGGCEATRAVWRKPVLGILVFGKQARKGLKKEAGPGFWTCGLGKGRGLYGP